MRADQPPLNLAFGKALTCPATKSPRRASRSNAAGRQGSSGDQPLRYVHALRRAVPLRYFRAGNRQGRPVAHCCFDPARRVPLLLGVGAVIRRTATGPARRLGWKPSDHRLSNWLQLTMPQVTACGRPGGSGGVDDNRPRTADFMAVDREARYRRRRPPQPAAAPARCAPVRTAIGAMAIASTWCSRSLR
jgi:hypothetical protein